MKYLPIYFISQIIVQSILITCLRVSENTKDILTGDEIFDHRIFLVFVALISLETQKSNEHNRTLLGHLSAIQTGGKFTGYAKSGG